MIKSGSMRISTGLRVGLMDFKTRQALAQTKQNLVNSFYSTSSEIPYLMIQEQELLVFV